MTHRPYPRDTPLAGIPPHFRGPLYEQYITEQLLANFNRDKPAWLAQHPAKPLPMGGGRADYGIRKHVTPHQSSGLPTRLPTGLPTGLPTRLPTGLPTGASR